MADLRGSKRGFEHDPDDDGEFEEDYLFSRKADKYMFIILRPDGKSWDFIKDTALGPKSGQHWGEIRVCLQAMYLIGIKLMTVGLEVTESESDPDSINPFTEDVLAGIVDQLTAEFDEASLMACELKS